MFKLIPQTFIDNLLSRIDIIEIIGTRVKLRRVGSNFVGLCPFHNEKTPSFTVNSNKQFFHCFGCGTNGSAISFIMQFEHLNFVEAIKNLATQAGIVVPQIDRDNDQACCSEIYKLMEKVAVFFEQQLTTSPSCINYLKSRGFTEEICKKFCIGYSTNTWDNLKSLYVSFPLIKQQLITAGLLVIKDGKTYSRFRNRIMFPIRNIRGHISGFGGRTLGNDSAKYLNSPETIIFHKADELYGLYEAKKSNNKLNFIIVVEGYLDVVALSQFGITNVVATLGTAISSKQIQLLLRNTSEIIFCFDGDQAGRSAAWRALENSLPLMRDGIQIKFLFLPDNDDPDSLIKKEHKDTFIKRLESSIPLTDFFFKQLLLNININTIDGKSKLAKMGKEWIKKMPHSIFQQLMLNKIAELANIDVLELKNLETGYLSLDIENKNKKIQENDIPISIQNAISILLHYPQLSTSIENIYDIKNIKINGIELLVKLISIIKKQPNMLMAAIIEHWRDSREFETLSVLACKKPIISMESLKSEFIGIIQLLKRTECEQIIKTLLLKASTIGLTGDEKLELQRLIAISKK